MPNRTYYVFKDGHCLDKFDDIYLAEYYAKHIGGKVYDFMRKHNT